MGCSRDEVVVAHDDRVVPAPTASAPVRPDPRIDWIEELRGRDVGGPAVGLAPHESDFFVVGRYVLPSADIGFLEPLTEAVDPTVRVFALWGLALARRPEILESHVCDRETVMVYADGCRGFEWTVGDLTQQFLREPAYLGNPLGHEISKDALVSTATVTKWASGCAKRTK